jgi:hypothetical protein
MLYLWLDWVDFQKVLGDFKDRIQKKEWLIVNTLGEGGIMVINSNGNIENGDYITTSNYLGYGEIQDDDLLHNYNQRNI